MSYRRPTRRHLARLSQLECALANAQNPLDSSTPKTEEEWLEAFRAMGQTQLFVHETDFPILLRRFESAVKLAQASVNPTFEPPPSYEPQMSRPARLQLWRSEQRFPEVHRVFTALLDMCIRAMSGRPPASMAEWERLKSWYLSVHEQLPQEKGDLLLPCNRTISRANIEVSMRANDSLIDEQVEQTLQTLRQLYELYGGIY